MNAKFVSESESLPNLVFELDDTVTCWIIGRDPDVAQLVIEDPKISRQHARCTLDSQEYFLENLSKTNPITINDQTLEESQELNDKDLVKIGPYFFRFFHTSEKKDNDLAPSSEDEENPYETIFDDFSDFDDDTGIDLTDTTRFLLKVLTGPNTGAEFALEEEQSYTIGTDTDNCDIVFHDLSVSRQHAKIFLDAQEQLFVEDLKSRNGVLVDGQIIEGKTPVSPNNLISLGTTTFTIIDREAASETIVSVAPLMTKVKDQEAKQESKEDLKEEKNDALATDAKEKEQASQKEIKPLEETQEVLPETKSPPRQWISVGMLFVLFITALAFTFINMAIALFKTEKVSIHTINYEELIKSHLDKHDEVAFNFNPSSGELFIYGHVVGSVDKIKLLYNLQNIPIISSISDFVVIDELVWKEHNEIFSKRQQWRGVSMHSPQAGRFVITGYLKKRQQAASLNEYLNANFRFIDLLENYVAVEEELIKQVNLSFEDQRPLFKDIKVSIIDGEVTLTGLFHSKDRDLFDKLIKDVEGLSGIRKVKNFTLELSPEQSIINITHKYSVTGYSQHDNVNLNVIINGKIISKGDALDGMIVTNIKPHMILLEKAGVKYKIDYNK